jgi:hypothetical protein
VEDFHSLKERIQEVLLKNRIISLPEGKDTGSSPEEQDHFTP